MTASPRSSGIGRYVFGASTLAFGIIALVWHDYKDRELLRNILNDADGPIFVFAAATLQIMGGGALLFRPGAKAGALLSGVVYLVFTLLCMPRIAAAPLTYDSWGNLFEQLSLLTGAVLIYARSSAWTPGTTGRVGRILLGVCTLSFTLEQAFYLKPTAAFVPKWAPPGQMFWAVATTVLFALAAAALLVNRMAVPATRLLALMILMFGLLVWVPALVSKPGSHNSWSETVETFAIAGVAWIVAEGLKGETLAYARGS